jgi:hypothetical protein
MRVLSDSSEKRQRFRIWGSSVDRGLRVDRVGSEGRGSEMRALARLRDALVSVGNRLWE